MRKLKSCLSIVLAICIIASVSSMGVYAVDISTNSYTNNVVIEKRLNNLLLHYPPNSSYFKSSYHNNDLNGDKSKPCNGYALSSGAINEDWSTCGYYDGAIQCLGYAFYAQSVLFGKTEKGKTEKAVEGATDIKYHKVWSPTKAQIMNMPLGTHIRNDSYDPHSVILLKSDSSKITYLDANCARTWSCAVHIHEETWSNFFSWKGIGVSSLEEGYATYPTKETYPKGVMYGETPFFDIGNHWANEKIEEAYLLEMISGVSENYFEPSGQMTRAMFVQVLYNMAGKPEAKDSWFDDVRLGSWYYNAVCWAEENGIVSGDGSGNFYPDKHITREEAAQIVYSMSISGSEFGKLIESADEIQKAFEFAYVADESVEDILNQFKDREKISPWAEPALRWAVEQKIMLGDTDRYLYPESDITRAEAVVMLLKFKDY